MKKPLDDLRKEIDVVDKELLKLLAKRFAIVKKIGEIKKENSISPLDEKRWQEVLNGVLKNAKKYILPQDFVKKIYEEIHKTALDIEEYE